METVRRLMLRSLATLAAAALVAPPVSAQSLQQMLNNAADGDTLFIPAGEYRECPVISRPVTLVAARDVTVGGNCPGSVLTVTAPATIKGLRITGTGTDLSREHSGIWADSAFPLVIEDNIITDVLFGIYVKQSADVVVRGNIVEGKDLPVANRGDGIRLWYSPRATVEDNHISRSRDLVIWFSDSAVVRHNTVVDSRYGLHYMYSNHSRFERNEFLRNEVGAFLMYSRYITFRHNLFAYSRGIFGKGLGFKASDHITASHNTIVKNAIGLYLDNSPTSIGVTNTFQKNVVAYNDVGVGMLPSVRNNRFEDGTFLDNIRPVTVTGGGTAEGNTWIRNYWSEYAGFDTDGDGFGDTPFQSARLSDDLFDKHDELRVFTLSPAAEVVDLVSRVLPTLRPTPIVVDSQPRLARPPTRPADAESPPVLIAGLFLVLAIGAGVSSVFLGRGVT